MAAPLTKRQRDGMIDARVASKLLKRVTREALGRNLSPEAWEAENEKRREEGKTLLDPSRRTMTTQAVKCTEMVLNRVLPVLKQIELQVEGNTMPETPDQLIAMGRELGMTDREIFGVDVIDVTPEDV